MKIVAAFLKYDYGVESRGISGERDIMFPEILKQCPDALPFWLEENGYPDDIAGLQERLIDFCSSEKPDFVFFVLMRDEIRPDTLIRLGSVTKTINWFCDDQWRFDDFSSKIALHLHTVITVDKFAVPKYRRLGCRNIIHTQWAAKEIAVMPESQYRYEISFVGAKNDVREWYVAELKKRNIHVECFGSGWENGRVSYERMNEIFRTSKINLNLSNSFPRDFSFFRVLEKKRKKELVRLLIRLLKIYRIKGYRTSLKNFVKLKNQTVGDLFETGKNIEQIKARNFEIPAACGFQISQFALEIEDYFNNGKDIVLYSNINDLSLLINYYLENGDEREAIRRAGIDIAKNNLYSNRFASIFGVLR